MFFFFDIYQNATKIPKTRTFLQFIIYAEGKKVKYKCESDHLIIEFFGEVDDHYAKNVRNDIDNLILKKNPRTVIFDFSHVSFVDSTGIGLIFGRYKRLLQCNGELLLRNIPSQVDKVFRASGVYSICPKI